MKKLVILFVSLLGAFHLQAQSETSVHFNPKVGIHVALLSAESSEDGVRMGLHAGADFLVKSRKQSWLFWQPGLHYYHTSLLMMQPGTPRQEPESQAYFNTLKIPMSGGLYLTGSDGVVRLRLNAGLTPTLLLGVPENAYGVTRDTFRGGALALNVGVGLEVLLVTLDVSYEHGFTPMVRDNQATQRIFSISAGIRF